jgi:iron complex transport system permease protein
MIEPGVFAKKITFIILLAIALFLGVLVAIALGSFSIPAGSVARVLLGKVPILGSHVGAEKVSKTIQTIILQVRLPRVILAIMVGSALSTAGVVYQALFRNPMADPYIIGISSGGAIGAAIAFLVGLNISFWGISIVPLFAFMGSIITAFVVYQLAKSGNKVPVASLLLSGLAVGAFISSILSFLLIVNGEDLHRIFFWLLGGLSARSWAHVRMCFPFLLTGLFFSVLFAKHLNISLLGEERAQHLGIEIESFKRIVFLFTSLLVASAVSVSGLIGFVGLMTPHIIRLIIGPDHRYLVPASALGGGLFLLVADLFARTVLSPAEIPVGIVTALFGVPFFIFLLKRKRPVIL